MLDRHPSIWGMGEDSVFNANLTALRDNIVAISSSSVDTYQNTADLEELLVDYGDQTVEKMKETAERLYYVEGKAGSDQSTVKYIVDKMLFNYKNIRKNLFLLLFSSFFSLIISLMFIL